MTADAFAARSFDEPDDRMAFPHGHADVVNVGGRRLLRVTFEPGFRWSRDIILKNFAASNCSDWTSSKNRG